MVFTTHTLVAGGQASHGGGPVNCCHTISPRIKMVATSISMVASPVRSLHHERRGRRLLSGVGTRWTVMWTVRRILTVMRPSSFALLGSRLRGRLKRRGRARITPKRVESPQGRGVSPDPISGLLGARRARARASRRVWRRRPRPEGRRLPLRAFGRRVLALVRIRLICKGLSRRLRVPGKYRADPRRGHDLPQTAGVW